MLLSTSDLQHLSSLNRSPSFNSILENLFLLVKLSHYNGPTSLKKLLYDLWLIYSNCAINIIFSDMWGHPQTYFVDDALAPESLYKLLGGGHREILGVVAHPSPPAVQVTGPWHGMSVIRKYAKFRTNISNAFL